MRLYNFLFRSKNYKPLYTIFCQKVSNQYVHLRVNNVIFVKSAIDSCVESIQQLIPEFYFLSNPRRCVRRVTTQIGMVKSRK